MIQRPIAEIAAEHGLSITDMADLPRDSWPWRVLVWGVRRLTRALWRMPRGLPGRSVLLRAFSRVPSSDDDREDYRDRSAYAGDEIVLGVYDDPEKRLASFFHELGHHLDDTTGRSLRPRPQNGQLVEPPGGAALLVYDRELFAWDTGLSRAKAEGYVFSKATLAWCDAQLASYIGWEEDEVRGWVTPDPGRVYDRTVLQKGPWR